MARKKNHGFKCNKHWKSVLADRFMIIHQFDGALCDSETFNDAERLYDRKSIRTLTPLDVNLGASVGPIHI